MPSTTAAQARKSLAKGAQPPVTSKELGEWEARWAPVLRDVFDRDVDQEFSVELAERLDEAMEGGRARPRMVAGKAKAARSARPHPARARAAMPEVGDKIKVKTRSGTRRAEVVEVKGSKRDPKYVVRYDDGSDETIDTRRLSRVLVDH